MVRSGMLWFDPPEMAGDRVPAGRPATHISCSTTGQQPHNNVYVYFAPSHLH